MHLLLLHGCAGNNIISFCYLTVTFITFAHTTFAYVRFSRQSVVSLVEKRHTWVILSPNRLQTSPPHQTLPVCLLFSLCSVMRTPPSVTRASTWVSPAARRISTAVPTCQPTCPSRGAPRRLSGSPRFSVLPNSHKMVIYQFTCSYLDTFPFSSLLICSFLCFQWTFWLFWTGRLIRTECWTSSVDYAR